MAEAKPKHYGMCCYRGGTADYLSPSIRFEFSYTT